MGNTDRQSNLSPAKQALFEKWMRGKFPADTIQKRPQKSPAPVSFAQQRLWFLDRLEPGNSFYNLPAAVRLTGRLNIAALEQSLNEIIQRHEVLRTTLAMVEGQLIQVIAPTLTFTLPSIDLRQIQESQQEAEVLRLAALEAQKPFDLAKGPLLRGTLLRLAAEEYVMLLTMHHIISDGWSLGVFIRELAALYEAFSTGKPSPLPDLPLQYADFAVWQRQWLQGEVLQTQLDYWKQKLGGRLPVLQLPTDKPRSPVSTYKGARRSLLLPEFLTSSLKTLSQKEGVTLFMTLLAAFKVLLYRYTGQEDILVGSPIANRNRAETEPLIGFFVNTLVLRTDISGNPSFRELLSRVREVALGAFAHQDLPFEKLVELQPKRDLSRNPLFQVMFALQNVPLPALELPGLVLKPLNIERGTTQFDLSLDVMEGVQGLSATIDYSTELFDAATITRMLGHFQTLLSGIVANPDAHLSDLPILSPSERQQLLVAWSNTQADYPLDRCIHELFGAAVEQFPDAIAVVFENQQLTYRELNQRANQLAHHLQKLGVKPEVMVGICVDRSLEMIIALLGILKAGGAYVPLDPAYPKERLAFMLSDSQVSVLLTGQKLVSWLPESGANVVCLDTDWGLISQESKENPIVRVNSDSLAYVIYTSGSTGTPKGVLITHQALVNHSIAAAEAYKLQMGDRILQFASISFDVAAEEFFPSWLSGSTVVIRPEQLLDIPSFLQFLEREKLTVLNLPTAYWHEWVTYLAQKETPLPNSLRLVIVGTEQANPEKLVLWQKIVGDGIRWINAYGPTEATIGATIYEPINNFENLQLSSVPIGRAIANTQIYLLDKHLNPTPIGVPGELYIGGVCLARGYLNQPELTAEKFIPNPFNNSKLYKTGDLARYLPNGDIELLGRIDHQVKIRGFRIELGEIEAKLCQHPNVREAVVVASEDSFGEKRLVAYIVPELQIEITSELRSFLKEKLPEYMVPSAFAVLPTLPKHPNAKVDRHSLPAPEAFRPELEVAYVMPQTEAEQTIATVWQKTLNLEKIGIHDNFFELGGHSLLLVRVHSQLRELFQTDLAILDLFRYPTISSLAEHLSQTKNQTSSFQETDIQPEKIEAGKAQQRKRLQKIKSIGKSEGV